MVFFLTNTSGLRPAAYFGGISHDGVVYSAFKFSEQTFR